MFSYFLLVQFPQAFRGILKGPLTRRRGVKPNNERFSGENVCVIGALCLRFVVLVMILHLQHVVSEEHYKQQHDSIRSFG